MIDWQWHDVKKLFGVTLPCPLRVKGKGENNPVVWFDYVQTRRGAKKEKLLSDLEVVFNQMKELSRSFNSMKIGGDEGIRLGLNKIKRKKNGKKQVLYWALTSNRSFHWIKIDEQVHIFNELFDQLNKPEKRVLVETRGMVNLLNEQVSLINAQYYVLVKHDADFERSKLIFESWQQNEMD